MTTASRRGALVLDCQGLSLLLRNDDDINHYVDAARTVRADLVTTGLTVLEAQHPRTDSRRMTHLLSTLKVVEADREIREHAGKLLRATGMHGHEHLVDAVVAAVALRQPRPTLLLTSDPDDLNRLCDQLDLARDGVKVVKV